MHWEGETFFDASEYFTQVTKDSSFQRYMPFTLFDVLCPCWFRYLTGDATCCTLNSITDEIFRSQYLWSNTNSISVKLWISVQDNCNTRKKKNWRYNQYHRLIHLILTNKWKKFMFVCLVFRSQSAFFILFYSFVMLIQSLSKMIFSIIIEQFIDNVCWTNDQ